MSDFKSFFHTYYNPLFNYAYAILKNEDEAEDVVQELFVDIWKKKSLSSIKEPDRYLTRAVKFRCINVINRDKKETVPYTDIAAENLFSKEETYLSEEDVMPLLHFFAAKLPPKTQAIFLLSRVEGCSNKEIAKRQGISIKTVENQMTRALKMMRQMLKDNDLLLVLLSAYIGK